MAKYYEIIKNTKRRDFNSVPVDGADDVKFNRSGYAWTADKGVAKEVEQSYGQKGTNEALVVPAEEPNMSADKVHNYSFTLRHLGDWKSRIDWSK